jgi:hypothetical protein
MGQQHGDGKEEIAHHPADFDKVRIGPAQMDANPQIGRQQPWESFGLAASAANVPTINATALLVSTSQLEAHRG